MGKIKSWIWVGLLAAITGANAMGAPTRTLFFGHENFGSEVDAVRLDILGSDPRFDHTNSASWNGPSLPTLATLLQYDSVLVWGNANPDSVALGDLLADYADAGGRVVLSTFWGYFQTGSSSGRIESTGYNPFENPTFDAYNPSTLGVHSSSNPLFQGVNGLSMNFFGADYLGGLDAGATLAGSWSDGRPLAGYNATGNVFAITLYPNVVEYGHASGDYRELFRNALTSDPFAAVPEPATISIAGAGLLMALAARRKRKSSRRNSVQL